MAASLESSDNSHRPSVDICSEVFVPKDTLDQPCNVILVVEDGKQFKAHKQVLSEASPFFEKLLNSDMKESKEGIVRLEMFSESVMRNALEFIYTGHVQIFTEDNARDLIVIADYLFLQNLKTLAERVLIQRLNVSNCFLNYNFSERFQCEELVSKTRKIILANFGAVYSAKQTETEILNMSSREIEMLISSDEINVSAEEEVFNLILSWINHDKNKRQKYFAELFRHVRLVYVSRDFLCSDVVTNDFLTGSEGCLDLVEDAVKLIESRDFSNLLVKPRNSLASSVIVIQMNDGMYCYIPHEDKWCRLSMNSYLNCFCGDSRGLLSCRGKLHTFLESPENTLNSLYKLQLAKCDPFSDKWTLLPYTDKTPRHLEQIFVKNQDELYALVSERCVWHGLCPQYSLLYMHFGFCTFCDKEKHVFFIIKYKHESNSWEDISSFSFDRCEICIVAKDNLIYFIGGRELYKEGYCFSREYRYEVDRYDIRKDQWSKVAHIHEGCHSPKGAALNEKFFIVGMPREMPFNAFEQCQVYDEITNVWQVIASPKYSGFLAGVYNVENLLAVDDKLYVVMQNYERRERKGENIPGGVLTVECYDPAQDKWNLKSEGFRGFRHKSVGTCSNAMRIYKPLLAEHQLERVNPFPISSTSSGKVGKRKCIIM